MTVESEYEILYNANLIEVIICHTALNIAVRLICLLIYV